MAETNGVQGDETYNICGYTIEKAGVCSDNDKNILEESIIRLQYQGFWLFHFSVLSIPDKL